MNKIIPSLVAAFALGGAVTWLVLKHPVAETTAAAPDTGPKIEAGTAAGKSQFTTKEPVAATLAAEVRGYGRVLDPAPLIAAAGEVAAARAVADASEKEFTRTETLHDNGENASQQAVETAEGAALRDRALLDAARAKLVATWGRSLVERNDLPALLHSLALGEVGLVRIDLLPGDAPEKAPATAQVGLLTGEAASHDAEVLGPAPATDAQAQGAGYFALLRTVPPAPGTALRATLTVPGEPQKVMIVPRSALVRHEGGVFVYVKASDGGYERRLVEVARNLPDDGVALAGTVVDENDKVVVTGAQQLLANEILGALGGGD